jgi:hypothetical protein
MFLEVVVTAFVLTAGVMGASFAFTWAVGSRNEPRETLTDRWRKLTEELPAGKQRKPKPKL